MSEGPFWLLYGAQTGTSQVRDESIWLGCGQRPGMRRWLGLRGYQESGKKLWAPGRIQKEGLTGFTEKLDVERKRHLT